MRWTAGSSAQFHNVYLATSPELGPAALVAARLPFTMYYHVPGLEPGVTYCWRVDEIEKDGVTTYTGDVWSFTTQALTAYHPAPADGAVDASPTPVLTWLPGRAAVGHHVYFGGRVQDVKDGTPAADKGTVTDPTFTPGVLEPVTTYYWRVDETVAGSGVKTGPVWGFTTYLPVEDFESYTDTEGSRIYETWIDGWTNGSGSTVGHVQAPFAERTIVHGGLQSMPMDYNNVKLPHSSETQRTFTPVVDWTVNGANWLVVYVHGRAANKQAQLYLAIDDAAGHNARTVSNDTTMLTTAKWNEWRTPIELFTKLGVNMTKVKRITIGVYDDPAGAGATGTFYLDDIRMIRVAP